VDLHQGDPAALAFQEAVERGDAASVRGLLTQHPQLREELEAPVFSFGGKALGEAAARGHREVVDALIDLGADLDGRSDWPNGPYTALHRLVDGASPERLELAEHIAARGATVDIHAAAGMGRVDRIREILDADPDAVSAPGPDGATPLHLARNVKVATLLLERGAEIDKRCVDHRSTAAMWAAGGREDVMRFLLERGATPDLFQAVLLDDVDLAQRIIERDPSALDVRVRFGHSHAHVGFGDKYVWALDGADTPLELARRRNAARTYAFLLDRSAPEWRLLQAARRDDVAEMQRLLSEHPGMLGPGPHGLSLSDDRVCEILCSGVVGARELLAAGANPNARDETMGATALHHAAWRGLSDLIPILLAGGADPTLKDRTHQGTPPEWARHAGRADILRLFILEEPS
jgi:ankyrin repeat protein